MAKHIWIIKTTDKKYVRLLMSIPNCSNVEIIKIY